MEAPTSSCKFDATIFQFRRPARNDTKSLLHAGLPFHTPPNLLPCLSQLEILCAEKAESLRLHRAQRQSLARKPRRLCLHLHEYGAARSCSGTATKEIKSYSSEVSTGSAQNSCSGEQPMSVACSMNEPHLPTGGSELKYHHLMTLKDFTHKHHHRLAFRGMYFSFFKNIKLDCPAVHRIV